ncbi:PREDICTED: putative helicase MOV-10 [Atta cephalotes]|uniref:AAA+ ATPase domain-containing protein n=1 Tax=Atta cephalotes TaxID=12957 RepID=A0A158P231_ATTCE|nr:PREDICTED: putative helicase MOV-10 [Atta cephalotes]
MQKKNKPENLMTCTAPAVAQILSLPEINFPYDLECALKNIYLGQSSSHCSDLCNNYIRCIESLPNVQRITELNYLIILKICLYLIQFELDLEMKKYTLLNYAIERYDSENNFIINMASLNIEPSKLIRPGDIAIFRETTNKARTSSSIRAKIINILKNKVTVKPPHPELAKILRDKEKRFNINFQSKHWPLRCCHYVLMIINECNWREIIYPQLKTNCTDMEFDIEWINTNIKENKRQKQAVMKILNNTARPAPYIIFGPPGTGKTATLVEAICQIVRQYPMKNILVCTLSNAAADEITKRLIKNIPINLIYRMYAPSREWSSVDKEIRPCANFVGDTTIFLSKDVLLLKKIIISTLSSSIRLIDENFRKNHFSYIIIDEASQATEPDMLIPLAITNQAEDEEIGFQAQIVIAGDPYQLGPVIRCRRIERLLGRSMLERLMNDCNPYKMQNGKYNPNYITKLIKNYRSHENLLYMSNKLFYNDELKFCGGADTQMALNWSQLPNKKFPMIFQEVLGTEQRCESLSVYNTAEVLSVLVYIDILMNTKFKTHAITQKDIGIITPFTRQQLHIKHYLTAMNYKDITVGTVETFQGQERNVIILSTARSKLFKHDSEEHIGFLSNPKRFNVALTRAKALTIIIGNPNILCKNEHWKLLWDYCKEHNGYIPFKQLPLKKNCKIAKLMGNLQTYSCNDSGTSTNLIVTEQKEKRKTEALFDVLVRKMESLTLRID